jgi:hypothetical protein
LKYPWFSGSEGQRQQILDSEEWLLPLVSASFIGFLAEAAKSCFQGQIAAFGPASFISKYIMFCISRQSMPEMYTQNIYAGLLPFTGRGRAQSMF